MPSGTPLVTAPVLSQTLPIAARLATSPRDAPGAQERRHPESPEEQYEKADQQQAPPSSRFALQILVGADQSLTPKDKEQRQGEEDEPHHLMKQLLCHPPKLRQELSNFIDTGRHRPHDLHRSPMLAKGSKAFQRFAGAHLSKVNPRAITLVFA